MAITKVLPLQSEAFLGAKTAVKQDCDYITKEIGIRLFRFLAAFDCANAL